MHNFVTDSVISTEHVTSMTTAHSIENISKTPYSQLNELSKLLDFSLQNDVTIAGYGIRNFEWWGIRNDAWSYIYVHI